jgi:precorrin-2 dehydrogenase / sirohydrochlorin ferrochelatase
MMVRIEGKKCLVVGGGKVAEGKIAGLLAHGAEIIVVSPRAVPSIRERARDGELTWLRRKFSPVDVRGAFLVIAATNAPGVNKGVFAACNKLGALCNAVDDPENCDFFYPAVVQRGPLQIAISTNGSSPALAKRLRRQLEKQFGPEWGEWVEQIGKVRRELLSRESSPKIRRERLQQMASPKAFRSFIEAERPKMGKKRSRRRD